MVLLLMMFISERPRAFVYSFFFFNDTATTEIYTLSLHDALPILQHFSDNQFVIVEQPSDLGHSEVRSEEHTSELQSLAYLVCRLLLEKKNHAAQHLLERISTPYAVFDRAMIMLEQ